MKIVDLRLIVSAELKRFPHFFWPIASFRENGLRTIVRRNTDIVIEGTFRCANHFAVYAFEDAQENQVKIAHHFHAPAQLLLAAKWRLPAILLIRDPTEVAISFCVFFPDADVETAFRVYNQFYSRLLGSLDNFVVSDFPDTTSNMSQLIRRVNQKFGTNFKAFDEINGPRRVQDHISARSGVTLRNRAVPDPERDPLKAEAKRKVLAALDTPVAREARRLYDICREHAASSEARPPTRQKESMPLTAGARSREVPVRKPGSAETVVIFRLGSLGDTVVSVPCFHLIARTFPDARRILLTNFQVSPVAAPAEMILKNGGFIDETVNYQIKERRLRKLFQLWRVLRRLDSKTLIYLTGGRSAFSNWRDLMFFRLCGFEHIIGSPTSPSLSKVRWDPATGEVEREAERLARVMAKVGPIDLNDLANWDLRLTKDELDAAAQFLAPLAGRPFVAINTGGKVKINDWGMSNWEALLSRLGARLPDTGLVVVGAREDEPRAEHLPQFWPGLVLSACGRLSPRESAAVLRDARLFVGHDSGPLHLAAAMGAPCVSMFGSNNPPKKWHPIGAHHRIIHNMSGVTAITVDQVLDAVDDALLASRTFSERLIGSCPASMA